MSLFQFLFALYLGSSCIMVFAALTCIILCILIGDFRIGGIYVNNRKMWFVGAWSWGIIFLVCFVSLFIINNVVSFAQTFNPLFSMFTRVGWASGFCGLAFYKLFNYLDMVDKRKKINKQTDVR